MFKHKLVIMSLKDKVGLIVTDEELLNRKSCLIVLYQYITNHPQMEYFKIIINLLKNSFTIYVVRN